MRVPGKVTAAARANANNEFVSWLACARRHLELALAEIDAAGEAAVKTTGNDRCDQLACFAGNTLQGALSLLRELEAEVRPRSASHAR